MENKIEELITALIPSIEQIDGGCNSCIKNFIEDANESLKKYNLKLTSKESLDFITTKVTLKKINPKKPLN